MDGFHHPSHVAAIFAAFQYRGATRVSGVSSHAVFSHDHHNFLADVRLSRLSLLQSSLALSLSPPRDDDETPDGDNDI